MARKCSSSICIFFRSLKEAVVQMLGMTLLYPHSRFLVGEGDQDVVPHQQLRTDSKLQTLAVMVFAYSKLSRILDTPFIGGSDVQVKNIFKVMARTFCSSKPGDVSGSYEHSLADFTSFIGAASNSMWNEKEFCKLVGVCQSAYDMYELRLHNFDEGVMDEVRHCLSKAL